MWTAALLRLVALGAGGTLARAAIPDGRWNGTAPLHHEDLWTFISSASDGKATDCPYLGDLVLADPATEFPGLCNSRAIVLGGDTFDVKTDHSKCYFKRCGAFADIRYTDRFGARDTYTTLIGPWVQILRQEEGVGSDCSYMGSLVPTVASQWKSECESRAMVLGADIFDVKPDNSKCYFKKCGAFTDIRITATYGAHHTYTVLGGQFTQFTRAAEGMSTDCPYLGSFVPTDPATEFPLACYSQAMTMGADTFDAKVDGSKCYFKRCGAFADVRFTDRYGARDSFTTLRGARWSQITHAADGKSTDCPYLGSFEPVDPANDFPRVCYSKALIMAADTFDAKTDGSKCYFKRCGAYADIRYTDRYGARDTSTTLIGGWSVLALAADGKTSDCAYLGSFMPADPSTEFPQACYSQCAIMGGDTFDAKVDGSKCYCKRCSEFADIRYTDRYGARDVYSLLFPRGDDGWGPCDPTTCLDFHLMYTSKVSGRHLPVGSSGETCDPDQASQCFGGTARRIAYMEAQKAKLARKGESVVFFDMGASTFGGPLWGHPEYPRGMPATILQNYVPYDFCVFSPRDLLDVRFEEGTNYDFTAELARSFTNRTCTFLVANVEFNGVFAPMNAKVVPYEVKEMLNGWKVAFVGMMPYVTGYGYSYGPDIVKLDRKGLLTAIQSSNFADVSMSAAELNASLLEVNAEFLRLPPHKRDIVILSTLATLDVLAAAEKAKRDNPGVRATVLLASHDQRQDQIDWLVQNGDFDVVLRERREGDPLLIPVPNKGTQLLLAGGETTFGVGHLKVRLNPSVGVEKFDFSADIALDGSISVNQTVQNVMSQMYEVTRRRNADPFGKMNVPLQGGHRGDETLPFKSQCYYTECNAGTYIGEAHLWKARQMGHKADVSLYNLGGLRAPLRGNENGTVFITHCVETLKFQNTLKIFDVLGKDLYESIKALVVPAERGFIGAGVRVAIHEPCWNYVNHFDYSGNEIASAPPGTPAEIAECQTTGGVSDADVKIIQMEVLHTDWSSCHNGDYANCSRKEWKTLEKGTMYTLVSTDYLQSVLFGFKSKQIAVGTDAQGLCDYIAHQGAEAQAKPSSYYQALGNVQYDTAQLGWAAGARIASVKTAQSIIEAAPECPEGMHLPPQARACQDCEAGKYSVEEAGKGKCQSCALGFFNPESGRSTCTPCSGGTYMNTTGSLICHVCPVGKKSELGASKCDDCKPGFSGATIGASECTRCEKGEYSDQRRMTSCHQCGAGFTTESTHSVSISDCVCPEGAYRPLAGATCEKCPDGMTCPLGSDIRNLGSNRTGTSSQFPYLNPRYWSSFEEPLSVYECRSDTKCPGGDPGSACGPNLRSQACEYCKDGYYWDGELCKECISSGFVFPCLPALFVPGVVAVLYFTSRDPIQKWDTWKSAIGIQVYVLLNHYQMLNLLADVAVVMPPLVTATTRAYGFTNNVLSVFEPNCIGFDSFGARMVSGSVVPIVVILITLATMGGSWIVARALKKPQAAMKFDGIHHVIGSLLFTFFSGIAAQALTLFKCLGNPNGQSTLAEDASVVCFESGEWQSMLYVGIFSVLLYCGLVGALFLRAAILAPTHGYFDNPSFQWRWKFLFVKFRPDVYWFGIISLFKNFLVNLGFAIFRLAVAQLLWVIVVLAIYTGVLVACKPFRRKSGTFTDVAASISLLFACYFLTWYAPREVAADGSINDGDIGKVFAVALVIMSCLPVMTAIPALFKIVIRRFVYRKEHARHLTELWQDVKLCCAAMVYMAPEEGADMLDHMGEWDRHYFRQLSLILKGELLGEGGYRMTSGLVHQKYYKYAEESVAHVVSSAQHHSGDNVKSLTSSAGVDDLLDQLHRVTSHRPSVGGQLSHMFSRKTTGNKAPGQVRRDLLEKVNAEYLEKSGKSSENLGTVENEESRQLAKALNLNRTLRV